MNFEWDAGKNRSNIRKHGFDLADAAETFQGALLVRPDTREEYGESRWIGIGMIRHPIAVVAFAERAEETVRIIQGRPIIMSASNTRKHSRTNWKRVDRLKDEEIDYSEIPQLGPIFLQRPYAGQAKRNRLRCALIQTFWLSFESTGKVIKPLSTRSFENMSRVASGALASCCTSSARALKFRTESHNKTVPASAACSRASTLNPSSEPSRITSSPTETSASPVTSTSVKSIEMRPTMGA